MVGSGERERGQEGESDFRQRGANRDSGRQQESSDMSLTMQRFL